MITRSDIVDAADRVAQRNGIDGLTVRRLCAELGVTAPVVYKHFANKAAIVDEVIDGIIGRIALPGPELGDWAERLRGCFLSAHDEVAPYGGLAARMSHEMPRSPSAQRNSTFLAELLDSAGLAADDATKVLYVVFVYIWGHLLAAEAARAIADDQHDDDRSRVLFLWGLDRLLDSFRREFG